MARIFLTHTPDMLRVALSVKAGRITPSAILRRLATDSRKNTLYVAFRGPDADSASMEAALQH